MKRLIKRLIIGLLCLFITIPCYGNYITNSKDLSPSFQSKNITSDIRTGSAGVENGIKKGLTFFADYKISSVKSSQFRGRGTPYFTASRDATHPATYVDSNGVIQLVTSSDTPRFSQGYYDSTGFHSQKGLMIEAAGTNYITDSMFGRAIGADDWGSLWGTITDTNSTILNISGAKERKVEYVFLGTEGDWENSLINYTANDTFDASAGNISCTVSFWAKGDVSGITTGVGNTQWFSFTAFTNAGAAVENIVLRAINQAVGDGLSATTWHRFSFSGTITDITARKVALSFISLSNVNKPAAGENFWFEITGVQIEKSPYATSFIPTTTAALTRNAEVLKYENAGNRTAAQETILVKFVPEFGDTENSNYNTMISSDTKKTALQYNPVGDSIVWYTNATDSGGSNVATTDIDNKNTSYVIGCISYGATADTNAEIFVNGVSKGTTNTNYTTPVWGTYWYLGLDNDGTQGVDAYIQSIEIFNRALSSSEIASESARMAAN